MNATKIAADVYAWTGSDGMTIVDDGAARIALWPEEAAALVAHLTAAIDAPLAHCIGAPSPSTKSCSWSGPAADARPVPAGDPDPIARRCPSCGALVGDGPLPVLPTEEEMDREQAPAVIAAIMAWPAVNLAKDLREIAAEVEKIEHRLFSFESADGLRLRVVVDRLRVLAGGPPTVTLDDDAGGAHDIDPLSDEAVGGAEGE